MNDLLIIGFIFFLIITSITLLILSFAKPKQKEDIANRLEKLKIRTETQQKQNFKESKVKIEKEINNLKKRVNPIATKISTPKLLKNYQELLIKAGKYNDNGMNLISTQVLFAFALPILFIVINFIIIGSSLSIIESFVIIIMMFALGYYYPIARLKRQIEDRQKSIFRTLPDVLDLLTICLEAGMGINEALTKVSEKMRDCPLKDEFDRVLQEIQVGMPRLQALRDMSKRVGMRELTTVIIAIIQAEQMGTGLAKALKIQSEIIRELRWQKAQELAQKAPVKIIIPVALFIFPTIFVVIFGPLVISFISGK